MLLSIAVTGWTFVSRCESVVPFATEKASCWQASHTASKRESAQQFHFSL